MINSKYSVGSGFMAIFPPSDIKYIVAPPQNYVIAGTIRGIEGDYVIGLWGIWKDGNDDVRIFALNKQTQKYILDKSFHSLTCLLTKIHLVLLRQLVKNITLGCLLQLIM